MGAFLRSQLAQPSRFAKTFAPFFCDLHLDPADCEAKNSA